MKHLVNWFAGLFGYELHKCEPPVPADILKFLNAAEGDLAFQHGRGTDDPSLLQDSSFTPCIRKSPDGRTASLIVEGWRFLPHSYALVNQWQLLALARRTDVAIKVIDLPFYAPRWKVQDGLFEPQADQTLRSLEAADPRERADVTLRIGFPLEFSSSPSRRTVVFGTSENQVIRRDQMSDLRSYQTLQMAGPPDQVRVLTPSRWSAEGFYKAGFKQENVLVVPHGADIETFHPMPRLRGHIRSSIPVAEGDFVFLSVGAMTGNKGIDLLLQAFAEVCRRFPHARLILKGIDPLYKSKDLLAQNLRLVPGRDRRRLLERIIYFGESLPHWKMAMLYQAADAYVAPYRAEGFNIPVLEAAACGIPIICTQGGPTDDFVNDDFARKIESHKMVSRHKDQEIWRLEPRLDHLIALMTSTIEDGSWRTRAALAGPPHVRTNYTWDRVTDTLLRKIFDE